MKKLGSYNVIAKIGAGGMAEVYKGVKAGAEGWSKTVALKCVLPPYQDQDSFRKMLVTEARLALLLEHPNIVQVLDFFESNGTYVMAMEYIHGQSFQRIRSHVARQGKDIPWEVTVYTAAQTLRGLNYAHKRSGSQGPLHIVHRDVSPQNILVSYDGHVKLSDFGIALANIEREETQSGIVKGKCKYLSPEQLRGKSATPQSDIFAMGSLLYEALLGVHPFAANSEYQVMARISDGLLPEQLEAKPPCPPEVWDVVLKALCLDPKDRPKDANEFRSQLEAGLPEPWRSDGMHALADKMNEWFPNEADREEEKLEMTQALGAGPPAENQTASTMKLSETPASPSRKTGVPRIGIGLFLFAVLGALVFFVYSRQVRTSSTRNVEPASLNQTVSETPPSPLPSVVPPSPIPSPKSAAKLPKNKQPSKKIVKKASPPKKTSMKKTTSVPLSQKKRGVLHVTGPKAAKLYLNGESFGTLPQKKPLDLTPGRYLVVIVPSQGKPKMQSVRIKPGSSGHVSYFETK